MLNRITDVRCEIAFEEEEILLCQGLCKKISEKLQLELLQGQVTVMKCEHQEECLERYYTLALK